MNSLSSIARAVSVPLNRLHHAVGEPVVSVLTYHRVLDEPDPLMPFEPDVMRFESEMRVLRECFTPLSLSEALEAMRARSVPPGAVCVTFDDGYQNNLDNALPVLKRLHIPATVFVATNFLDGGVMFNDCVIESIRGSNAETLQLDELAIGPLTLASMEDKGSCIKQVLAGVKYLTPERRSCVLDELKERTGVFPRSQMLTTEGLRALHASGIEIGAHTRHHPILAAVDDEYASAEVTDSKRKLEELLGAAVRYFAYPNGKYASDYDDRHVEMVKAAGYEAACTTEPGVVRSSSDLFQLPRFRPWDEGYLRFWGRMWQARLGGVA